MKKPRRPLMLILGCCLLAFAILVLYECFQTGISQAGAETARFAPFFAYQLKPQPKGEPSPEVRDLQVAALEYYAEKFRNAAAKTSDMKVVAGLPEVAPGALQVFFQGRISATVPLLWPYVLSGSFAVMGNTLGDEPLVAFYNPYFDVAILSKWKFVADPNTQPGFKLFEAVPVTGRAFLENRASLAKDQPLWAESPAQLFESKIVAAAQAFTVAFENRYPPFGLKAAKLAADARTAGVAVALIEERVYYLMRWVVDAQNPEAKVNYAAAIKQLRKALSASTPDQFEALLPKDNPQPAELIFKLPQGIREGMKVYLVVDKNVIFIDPLKPTVFLSTYFEPSDSGYKLALAMLFNLAAGDTPSK